MKKVVHIVFSESARYSLEESFKINTILAGKIIVLSDNLAMGPLADLSTPGGVKARREWLKKILRETTGNMSVLRSVSGDLKKIEYLKANPGNSQFCIWRGEDARNRTGFMRLMGELKGNLPQLFVMQYPRQRFQYPTGRGRFQGIEILTPQQIAGLHQYVRPLTVSEKKAAINHWIEISSTTSTLRISQGIERVRPVPDHFYDRQILAHCQADFVNTAFVVGSTLASLALTQKWIADIYLFWRMKELIKEGKLEARGKWDNLREWKVRLPVG